MSRICILLRYEMTFQCRGHIWSLNISNHHKITLPVDKSLNVISKEERCYVPWHFIALHGKSLVQSLMAIKFVLHFAFCVLRFASFSARPNDSSHLQIRTLYCQSIRNFRVRSMLLVSFRLHVRKLKQSFDMLKGTSTLRICNPWQWQKWVK